MFVFYWLVFMIPMPDYRLWAYEVGPLTVIKCVGLLSLAAALVRLAMSHRVPPFYRLPEAWCTLLYLSAAFASYTWRDLAAEGPEGLEKAVAVLALLIVTAIMVDTPGRFHTTILFAVAGEAICALYVVRQWVQFGLVYREFRSFGGLTDDANYFALSVVLWLPVTLLWMGKGESRLKRVFWAASALAMFIGFLISGSRGGLLGLTLAGLLLIWRTRQRLRNFALVAFASLLVLAASTLSGSSAVSRILNPTAGDVASTQSRYDLWRTGLRVVEQHPFIGVGATAWTYALSHHAHYNVSHNTYLDVLGQLGLAGFLPFMGILIFTFRRLGRLSGPRSDAPGALARAATGFRAALAGYFVAAFFLSSWWQQVLWLLVFLSMTMPWLRPVTASESSAAWHNYGLRNRRERDLAPSDEPSGAPRRAEPLARPRVTGWRQR